MRDLRLSGDDLHGVGEDVEAGVSGTVGSQEVLYNI